MPRTDTTTVNPDSTDKFSNISALKSICTHRHSHRCDETCLEHIKSSHVNDRHAQFTSDHEQHLLWYYCANIATLCSTFRCSMTTQTTSTIIFHLFYLFYSIQTIRPDIMMVICMELASKDTVDADRVRDVAAAVRVMPSEVKENRSRAHNFCELMSKRITLLREPIQILDRLIEALQYQCEDLATKRKGHIDIQSLRQTAYTYIAVFCRYRDSYMVHPSVNIAVGALELSAGSADVKLVTDCINCLVRTKTNPNLDTDIVRQSLTICSDASASMTTRNAMHTKLNICRTTWSLYKKCFPTMFRSKRDHPVRDDKNNRHQDFRCELDDQNSSLVDIALRPSVVTHVD